MNQKVFFILVAIAAIFGGYLIWQKYHESSNKNTSTPTDSITISSASTPNPSPSPTNKEKIATYQVPILMYHYIRDFNDPEDKIGTNLSVSPINFEKQLKWLKDNGYQSINPSDLEKLNEGSFNFAQDKNPKYMIFTFDDGYRDAYTDAFPILKKFDFMGTFYIISDYVDRQNENYLTWTMIQEMSTSGMNIGSHTLTHPDLTKCTTDRVNRELIDSEKIIKEKIEKTITDFCYPSGKYNEEIISQIENAGYKTATTVKNGIADQNSSLFELPRIRVQNETNLSNALK